MMLSGFGNSRTVGGLRRLSEPPISFSTEAPAFADAVRSSLKRAAIWLPNGSFQICGCCKIGGMKRTKKPVHVTLQINARTFTEFTQANRTIKRWTGTAPGVEKLMAFMLRAENDAEDIAIIYCFKALRQPIEVIDGYRRR